MTSYLALLFIIGGLVWGNVGFHYVCVLLGKEHRILSLQNILFSIVNTACWLLIYFSKEVSIRTILFVLASTALCCLACIDWQTYEIPIQFNYFIFALGIINLIMNYKDWINYCIGALLVSMIFFIIFKVSKERAMGGGDVKLMFTVGLLLGWKEILAVMIIGSLLGAIIHSIIMKCFDKDHMLAFGPYLAGASIIIMCFGDKLIGWYINYFLSFN